MANLNLARFDFQNFSCQHHSIKSYQDRQRKLRIVLQECSTCNGMDSNFWQRRGAVWEFILTPNL